MIYDSLNYMLSAHRARKRMERGALPLTGSAAMRDFDPYAIWQGLDADFVAGYTDGRNPETPEPSANRHPAYRHSWEIGRGEIEGWLIPIEWSRKRVAHIEQGGDFYPYAKDARHA